MNIINLVLEVWTTEVTFLFVNYTSFGLLITYLVESLYSVVIYEVHIKLVYGVILF